MNAAPVAVSPMMNTNMFTGMLHSGTTTLPAGSKIKRDGTGGTRGKDDTFVAELSKAFAAAQTAAGAGMAAGCVSGSLAAVTYEKMDAYLRTMFLTSQLLQNRDEDDDDEEDDDDSD